MQKKYGKDGLVVLAVHVEIGKEKTPAKKIADFLKKVEPTFPNYYLDEAPEFWMDRLHADKGVPVAFVFDRRGKWRQYGSEDEVDHEKVEATVKKYLAEP